jgi:molecular chaperone HscA
MLLDSFEHAEGDLAARNFRVEKVEAERILDATRSAVEKDPQLLEDSVRADIDRATAELVKACDGDSHVAIRRAIEALDYASKPFAEKRMNRAIRAAVSGKRVDDVEQDLG